MRTKEFKKEIKEIVKRANKHNDYCLEVIYISRALKKYFGYYGLLSNIDGLKNIYKKDDFDYNLKVGFNILEKALGDKRTDDIKVLLPVIIGNITFNNKTTFMNIMSDLTDEDGEIVLEEDEIRM